MPNHYLDAVRQQRKQQVPPAGGAYMDALRRQRALRTPVSPRSPSDVDRYLAGSVGQETLGPGGTIGMKIRADLALSDTIEEKTAKFKRYFPEGDLVFVETPKEVPTHAMDPAFNRTAILVRRSKKEPFGRLDIPGPEDIGGDIADLAGAAPGVAADIALAAATRGRSLMRTLPRQMAGFAGSAAGGDVLRQTAEQVRGLQFESPSEVAGRAAEVGVAGGLGTLLAVPFTGAANIVRGAGVFGTKPAAEAAEAAGRRQGLPPLMPHQVTDNPLLEIAGRQAGRLAPTVGRAVATQKDAALAALAARRDPASLGMLAGHLETAYIRARDKLLKAVQYIPTTVETAGEALQAGLKNWARLSRDLVNKKYADARAAGSVTLNLAPAQEVATKLGAVKMGLERPVTVKGITTQAPRSIGAEPSSELQAVIGDIRALDPKVSDVVVAGTPTSAIEQVRALQQRLYDLKTPGFGQEVDYSNKLAGELFDALEKVLDNPVSGNVTAIAVWKEARKTASERFKVLDQLHATVSALDRNYNPFSLADSLLKPGAHDKIAFVKKTLEARGLSARWDALGEAFQTRLMRMEGMQPGSINRELDKFQPETLDLILPKQQQTVLRFTGKGLEELESIGIQKALQKQTQAIALVADLIAKNDTASLARLFANAPIESPLGKSIRAGLIDDVVSKSTRVGKSGSKELDRAVLETNLAALDASGAGRWLTAADRQALGDVEQYLRFVTGPGAEAGVSIQAAGLGSGLVQMSGTALATVMHYIGVGRLLTSSFGARVLTGRAHRKLPFIGLKAIGAMAFQIAAEMQKGNQPPTGPK